MAVTMVKEVVGSVICKGVGMHPLGHCNLIGHLLISGSEYNFGIGADTCGLPS